MSPDTIAAWVDAALADGWTSEPTYRGEPEEQARTLRRDGWVAMLFSRPQRDPMVRPECHATVWAPDKLQVRVPESYDFAALQAATRVCQYCGATDVETVRLTFAGRACRPCREKLAPTYEKPGWCD